MKLSQRQSTLLWLCATLIVAGFLHGWNMFHFPYYESDEGTYISQAWSLVKEGELAPYTYWYDHPPVGWITMAGWAQLFGGDFFFFGESSVDHMRVFMLVIHMATTALLFFITRQITRNNLVAVAAGIVFSLSPLFIYFQRRVLLDNIMVFFVLASLAPLFLSRVKLRHYIISAILFALAVLVKIPAIFFLPAFIAVVLYKKSRVSPLFRMSLWTSIFILVGTLFLLYASLRGELLPDSITGGTHVSFLSSFFFQLERSGGSVWFWEGGSHFREALHEWFLKDAVAVWGVMLSFVMSVIVMRQKRQIVFIALFAVCYLFFLIRGGIVTDFYLIPLVPFVAMLFATSLYAMTRFVTRKKLARTLLFVSIILSIGAYYAFFASQAHFIQDETSRQVAATRWVKEHIPADKAIIVDSYALTDLWDPTYINAKTFSHVDWFYKINRDPEIRDEKYHADWRTIDYIFLNHELLTQLQNPEEYPITKEAFEHAQPVMKWTAGSSAYIDEQKFISTNGDWAMLYQVNDASTHQLATTWEFYKSRFIHGYGQVIDPAKGISTSEAQAYAMLRAVWMNDHETFKGTWKWTQEHLQSRIGDRLISQSWDGQRVVESANLTSADEDIALALLFAARLWDEEAYRIAAEGIIYDLWTHNVIQINGTYFLLPMHKESAQRDNGYLFNPSHLSPAWYRIFADVDSAHDWAQLADDTYDVLHTIGRMPGNVTYLTPEWLFLDGQTGVFTSAQHYFTEDVDSFGFDAFRTLWRVGMDLQWFAATDAQAYLTKVNTFLVPYYRTHGFLPAVLPRDGNATHIHNSLATNSGYLAALKAYPEQHVSVDFYRAFFEEQFDEGGAYWESPEAFYRANWAWFGVGLFNGDLPNMWRSVVQ